MIKMFIFNIFPLHTYHKGKLYIDKRYTKREVVYFIYNITYIKIVDIKIVDIPQGKIVY